jgi:hypothetical protein
MIATKKPHKHAEVIKAWADGSSVQFLQEHTEGNCWVDIADPSWNVTKEYRVKPRVFPKSSLNSVELYDMWAAGSACGPITDIMKHIADEAVKRHILDLEKEAANGF